MQRDDHPATTASYGAPTRDGRRATRRLPAVLAALLVGCGTLSLGSASAQPHAAPDKADWPGCGNDTGVTVVVDMTALGGDIVVRCAQGPGGSSYTGLEALRDAGFSVTGTQRWGNAFVCRIQGRPAASESLVIPGDDDYRERCADTPPQTAYWGYYQAGNGGSWKYSSSSASSRGTTAGGFEGWKFSLQSAGETGAPGFTPARPKWTDSPEPDDDDQPAEEPTSEQGGGDGGDRPDEGGDPTGAPGDDVAGDGDTDTEGEAPSRDEPMQVEGEQVPAGSDGSTEPTESGGDPAPTSDEQTDDSQVTGELPAEPEAASSGGTSAAPLVGFALLAVLAAGAGVTAWRRSRRA